MPRELHRMRSILALSGIAVFAISGCAVPDPVSPRADTIPSRVNPYIEDEVSEEGTENSCPREVPEDECLPMSQQERDLLWWDVQIGIQWDRQACAEIGRVMQDFVRTGDLRKWHRQTIAVGTWTNAWGTPWNFKPQRVSLRSDLLGWWQGRLSTLMHEGSHLWHQRGTSVHNYDVGGAFWVEDNCLNN